MPREPVSNIVGQGNPGSRLTWGEIADHLGWHDHNMRRDRPYTGQPHTTTGERGKTEVKGLTFRDLRDCYVRAVLLTTGGRTIDGVDMQPLYEEACKGERAVLCEDDLFGWNLDKLDPIAIVQNLACEVEKAMGIFPNLPGFASTEGDGNG